MRFPRPCLAAGAVLLIAQPAAAQRIDLLTPSDTVRVQLVNVDFRAAVQALAQYLDRPLIFGGVPGGRVTVETPRPILRVEAVNLLRSLVESQNHELITDSGGFYRVRSRDQQPRPVQPAAQRPVGVPELFVVRLRHARAADVAATVNALYGRSSALGEMAAPPPTLSDQLRLNQVPPTGAPPAQLAQGAAGRAATLAGDVVIVPDPGTNSLLIRASRSDFDLLQAAIQELDIRPLQVLIEILIVEVRRDRSSAWGTEWTLAETAVGNGGASASGSIAGLGLGDLVLRVMHMGSGQLSATLSASAATGNATILSRPVLLTANNEQATISVGSQRPFVQVSRSLPTQAPTRDQVVQYKDVGTSLTITPTISGNGYVTLEVSQEVNAATAETQFDAPVISTRSVRTQLLVRDSQTVILGGLTDRQAERTSGGVPLLSEIPLIGGLFGRQGRRTSDTELLLFLTPRIIRNDEDADAVTGPRQQRAPELR
jgi:general secretion pathway protein D